jgi:hypothetical protein
MLMVNCAVLLGIVAWARTRIQDEVQHTQQALEQAKAERNRADTAAAVAQAAQTQARVERMLADKLRYELVRKQEEVDALTHQLRQYATD